jgi:hypothetical protein
MTSKELFEHFLDFGYKIHKQTELQENLVGHQGVLFGSPGRLVSIV